MTEGECSGFWNGCGFQWMVEYLGPNLAAIIVVSIAILYIVDYLKRDKPKSGNLDLQAAENNKQDSHASTDIRHIKGTRK